ncbi:hypothetical protein COT75_03695 [Candidatus Beckwithbacteria bacterium CG10_big_fil_rev_8_21_14_0_10_34_10]|uniref:SGNH hydrolase-type esterase domain-containing protein n=1 Tax=Candidatus Beckwithbacteria bacterium CG10_big_fil_rev_8_21_14_0_10_34_10 TaxID=1974495 RepID=A0A2H0W8E6_9BACT|nr:MAG: hypothetical protein COT75_03695 [Candidatus Beckwithbacteria bacterium CG10_big_fil_rev_8_21_14_0_10_34_10]
MKKVKTFLFLLIFLLTTLLSYKYFFPKNNLATFLSPKNNVLGESQTTNQEKNNLSNKVENSNNEAQSFSDLIDEEIENKKLLEKEYQGLKQSSFEGDLNIVLFGDSQIKNTNASNLKTELKPYFPLANIFIHFYGSNDPNIESGFKRLENSLNSINKLEPSLIIINSYASSPFLEKEDQLFRHWAGLAKMIDFIDHKTKAQVLIMADPLLVQESNQKAEESTEITLEEKYLQNTIQFSKAHQIPLANLYELSLKENLALNSALIEKILAEAISQLDFK